MLLQRFINSETIRFNPYVDSWQYAAAPVVADKAYDSVTIELVYDYNVNAAWFDGIQLYKEEFGTSYTYDENGNILSVSDGTNETSYVYDSAGQLIRENNEVADKTWVWVYDNAGNILSRSEYGYTKESLEGVTPTDTVNYTYGDDDWGDLLTAYDGVTISYDEIGNPLSDGTWTYTWEHGRELSAMTDGTTTWTYTYNADGLRTQRTNGTNTYKYVYNGSSLTQMMVGSDVLYFTSDTVTYNNTVYYYVKNIQGDIVAILDTDGDAVVQYTYDAWGNILTTTGELANTLGQINPLRYRGYVYDTETGLYYLQSRYYDPEIGRFLNADAFASTGQGILGNNMFAYCNNNPVCYSDHTGELTDGQIHNSVLAAIIISYMQNGYYYLSMVDTMIYYNGENIWNGWGFCDLYDMQTGEVWELKKASSSYTCTTRYAKRQLGRYVNGRLASDPDLVLSRGGELVFEEHTYTIRDSNGTYTITYWQECEGILRYSYTFQKDNTNDEQAVQKARLACIIIAVPIVIAGFCVSGGAGAAAAIPFAIAAAAA